MITRLIHLVFPLVILCLVGLWVLGRLELRGLVPATSFTLQAARSSVWIGHDWASVWGFFRRAL
jgi:hypothetical protein